MSVSWSASMRRVSLASFLIRIPKRSLSGARQFFLLIAARVRIWILRRHPRHIPVIERHHKEAQQSQDNGEIGEHVPPKAFFGLIVEAAPWAIGHRIVPQVGVAALRTVIQLGTFGHRLFRIWKVT